MLPNVKYFFNMPKKLVFHGSFKTESDKSNVLLLLPKTKGPLGNKKFKNLLKNDFNLLEYDDVLTEELGIFDTTYSSSLEYKASAVNIALEYWKGIEFHIICHSTGCGLGAFLANFNKDTCKSLILISPWYKRDKNFTALQMRRIENAKKLDTILFLKAEYNLLYSSEYTSKFKMDFKQHLLNQKDKIVDAVQMKKRLLSILDCNIGDVLCNLEMPMLFINAVDDKLMKVYHGQELHKNSTNSNLISLDNGGHMLTETRTDDLDFYIKSFINTLGK